MRVITKTALKIAAKNNPQWACGIALWMDTFSNSLQFESYRQIKALWKNQTGWNVDRISAKHLKKQDTGSHPIYIFDIHNTDARIITRINERYRVIYIIGFFSHAAYDKWWKTNLK